MVGAVVSGKKCFGDGTFSAVDVLGNYGKGVCAWGEGKIEGKLRIRAAIVAKCNQVIAIERVGDVGDSLIAGAHLAGEMSVTRPVQGGTLRSTGCIFDGRSVRAHQP